MTMRLQWVQVLGSDPSIPSDSPNYVESSPLIYEYKVFSSQEVDMIARTKRQLKNISTTDSDPAVTSTGKVVRKVTPETDSVIYDTSSINNLNDEKTATLETNQNIRMRVNKIVIDLSRELDKTKLCTNSKDITHYDKTKSFFDDLSQDLVDKKKKNDKNTSNTNPVVFKDMKNTFLHRRDDYNKANNYTYNNNNNMLSDAKNTKNQQQYNNTIESNEKTNDVLSTRKNTSTTRRNINSYTKETVDPITHTDKFVPSYMFNKRRPSKYNRSTSYNTTIDDKNGDTKNDKNSKHISIPSRKQLT